MFHFLIQRRECLLHLRAYDTAPPGSCQNYFHQKGQTTFGDVMRGWDKKMYSTDGTSIQLRPQNDDQAGLFQKCVNAF
jgi:hypothetical protein